MANEDGRDERMLEERQAGLYPIGRALRATYDAENHDSLGQDLTGLMLALARVDPAAAAGTAAGQPVMTAPSPPLPRAGPMTPSWWARLWGRG